MINPLDSRETAKFLYEEIVCRYGVPTFIRCDQDTEFEGDFSRLCVDLGIVRRCISSLNPRANGLIERYNREIKSGIRKMTTMCPRA